ncbi:MAG: hypothetical protein KC684_07260, partial [Candidatus Omnitrophica bacterium]|nr:hypothetical protein [Candidatus Omnitrophota bacterium]
SPGTYHQDYVDTTETGEILAALIIAGDTRIAEELLLGSANRPVNFSFYAISSGGTQPIGSSLAINSGTPYRKGGEFRNGYPTDFTADSQASIANASLLLWKATGNELAKELSVNLVKILIRDFYPISERDSSQFVGAFSEKVFEENLGGFKSQPEIYSVETNSKISMLLDTMEQVLQEEKDFRAELADKKENLKEFFVNEVMLRVGKDYIVPSGIFEIKEGENTDLGEIIHTSTSGWLSFIEAGQEMKIIDDKTASRLLGNVIVGHGVKIDKLYGLDVSVAQRESMIFPAATAQALNVAKQIGHEKYEIVLETALAGYQRTPEQLLPQVVGTDPASINPVFGIDSAKGQAVYPHAKGDRWGASPAAEAQAFLAQETKSPYRAALSQERVAEPKVTKVVRPNLWLVWTVLGAVVFFLLLPIYKWIYGLLTKGFLRKKNLEVMGIDKRALAETTSYIKDVLGVKSLEGGRVHIISRDGDLGILAANGFVALVAYLRKQKKNVDEKDIRELITTWVSFFANEFKEQNKYYAETHKSWIKGLWTDVRRILGIRGKTGSDFYTNPRYHVQTIINDYMWNFVDELRRKKIKPVQILDSLKGKGFEEKYRQFTYGETDEVPHVAISTFAHTWPVVTLAFVAGIILRSEFTNLPLPLYNFFNNTVISNFLPAHLQKSTGSIHIVNAFVSQWSAYQELFMVGAGFLATS